MGSGASCAACRCCGVDEVTRLADRLCKAFPVHTSEQRDVVSYVSRHRHREIDTTTAVQALNAYWTRCSVREVNTQRHPLAEPLFGSYSRHYIGDRSGELIAGAMQINTTVTSLKLNEGDIGPGTALGIGVVLATNTTLTELDLTGNDLTGLSMEAIGLGLSANTTLTTLCLDRNHVRPSHCSLLATNATLRSLSLRLSYIGSTGCELLWMALAANTALTFLNLSHNMIDDDRSKAISAGLARNATLKTLMLSNNQISDEGCRAIGASLAVNTTLTELCLYGNPISANVCSTVLAAVHRNRTRPGLSWSSRGLLVTLLVAVSKRGVGKATAQTRPSA